MVHDSEGLTEAWAGVWVGEGIGEWDAGRAQLAEKGWKASFRCAAGPGGFWQAVANNGKLAFF